MSFTSSSSQLSNVDVQVIFMNGLKPQTLESIVQDHLTTVQTNTDIARKEVWFIAQTVEQFFDAFHWTMDNPTGTPINKRLFFLATDNPNWNSINFWLRRDQRIFCLTDNWQVWFAFWGLVWTYQLGQFLHPFLKR